MFDAPRDYLTHCYAREGLTPLLEKMAADFLLHKKPFSILIMDVDHFKSFNDRYGHLNGDEILKYFSSSMRLDLEDEENQPFRFGGDEFIAVFPSKNAGEAYRLTSRFRKNIKTRSCLIKGRQVAVTFSGGIASYPHDAKNIDELMEKADKALYYSKNHGRARVTRYDDIPFQNVMRVLSYVVVIAAGLLVINLLTMDFSSEIKKFNVWQDEWYEKIFSYQARLFQPKAAPAAPVLPPPPAQPPPEAEKIPVASEEKPVSKVYLKSGRMIEGNILSEKNEEIEVGLGLREGKGSLRFKKSQISKIQTGSESRSFD